MNHTLKNFSSSFFNFSDPNGTQPTITIKEFNVHDIISQICSQYSNWTITAIITIILVDITYMFLLRPKHEELRKSLFRNDPQEIVGFNLIMLIYILITMIA